MRRRSQGGLPSELFTYAAAVSRSWLPAVLDSLATIPPTICGGDSCSIFLLSGEQLHLAASTRAEAKNHLFDVSVAYATKKVLLRRAAADHARGDVNLNGSLTGWVAAFDRPLRLRDQRDANEHAAHASPRHRIPPPVWSNRGGGFYDSLGLKPFLAVPMRHGNKVHGVVRVVSLRAEAEAFTKEQEDRLLHFGGHLASFLVDHKLLGAGLEYYFRIWAARNGEELVDRIADAVPRLFNVDCCSFFQRDHEGRFVLRTAAASRRVRKIPVVQRHFEAFKKGGVANLFYRDGQSKTAMCIKTQAPLLLRRDGRGRWMVEIGKADKSLRAESHPEFLGAEAPRQRCEIPADLSKAILLVPVRDAINPRMLAGVIRVVSMGQRQLSERNLIELAQFADSLSHRLGETTRQEIEGLSAGRLIQELTDLAGNSERWAAAARIIGEALDADATTIFLNSGDKLRAEPEWSYLYEDQIRRDPELSLVPLKEQHGIFQKFVSQMAYSVGEGRTGWPAQHRRIINLKDLNDQQELNRWGASSGPFQPKGKDAVHHFCELLEPGPFIGAPILSPFSPTVGGVIRALRARNNCKGPFTGSHELILATCATVLAAFSRVGTPEILISYSNAALKDQLETILRPWVLPLSAGGAPPNRDASRPFEDLLKQRPTAAIVIATRRHRVGNHWQTSDNVVYEIGQLSQTLPERTLVLKEAGVRIADVSNLPEREFGRKEFFKLFPIVIGQLRDWQILR